MKFLMFMVFAFFMVSCSQFENIRTSSAMFHPAMNDGFLLDMSRSSMITTLESLDQNTGGGGCSVCAK